MALMTTMIMITMIRKKKEDDETSSDLEVKRSYSEFTTSKLDSRTIRTTPLYGNLGTSIINASDASNLLMPPILYHNVNGASIMNGNQTIVAPQLGLGKVFSSSISPLPGGPWEATYGGPPAVIVNNSNNFKISNSPEKPVSILSVGRCKSRIGQTGVERYKLGTVIEKNLEMGPNFQVSNIACENGYQGVARASPCTVPDDYYVLSGCERVAATPTNKGPPITVNMHFTESTTASTSTGTITQATTTNPTNKDSGSTVNPHFPESTTATRPTTTTDTTTQKTTTTKCGPKNGGIWDGTSWEIKTGRGNCDNRGELVKESYVTATEEEARKACADAKECLQYVWSGDDTEAKHGTWLCKEDHYDETHNSDRWSHWKIGRKIYTGCTYSRTQTTGHAHT